MRNFQHAGLQYIQAAWNELSLKLTVIADPCDVRCSDLSPDSNKLETIRPEQLSVLNVAGNQLAIAHFTTA